MVRTRARCEPPQLVDGHQLRRPEPGVDEQLGQPRRGEQDGGSILVGHGQSMVHVVRRASHVAVQAQERRTPAPDREAQLGIPTRRTSRGGPVRLRQQADEGRCVDTPADDRVHVMVDQGHRARAPR